MIDIDFNNLRESFPRLYRTVSQAFGHTNGTHSVDISKLNDFTRGELSAWFREKPTPTPPQPVVEPAAPVVEKQVVVVVKREEPEEIREAMDVSKNDERRRVEQQAYDEARGFARMQWWVDEGGMEPTPQNAQLVKDFIDASPVKGYWSREIVDAAIANLGPRGSNQLTWTPKTVEPPPAPAEPAEVLGTLPNGEPRLPLGVPPTNKASKEQVKDWLARTREVTGKYLRPRGSFGSKFI